MRLPASGRHLAGVRRRPRGGAIVAAVLAVAAIVLGVLAVASVGGADDSAAMSDRPAARQPVGQQSTGSVPPSTTLQTPVDVAPQPAAAGVPVRVALSRLGIDSPLDRLGLTPGGLLETPPSFGRAAWFAGGVRPGDVGPAIIAGHVDSRSGPAVFFALRRIRRDDTVDVRDTGGVVRRFVVTDVRRFAKAAFGTAEVYGPTAQPELRLITCTGTFDSARRSYLDNLVVFATLRGPRAG